MLVIAVAAFAAPLDESERGEQPLQVTETDDRVRVREKLIIKL
jgi:hypothetical protein